MRESYFLLLIALGFALIAQARVRLTFNRYNKVKSRSGLTGEVVARKLLEHSGIAGIRIERTDEKLGDNFNPIDRVVRLSNDVYNGDSVAAIGVAAHEIGHVIQHENGYFPIRVRTAVFPVVSFSSHAAIPIFFIGLIFSMQPLILAGIILFLLVTTFQVITLPVEFDASHRALVEIKNNQILQEDELSMAKSVLNAAALTYVAALVMSIVQLLRLIALASKKR